MKGTICHFLSHGPNWTFYCRHLAYKLEFESYNSDCLIVDANKWHNQTHPLTCPARPCQLAQHQQCTCCVAVTVSHVLPAAVDFQQFEISSIHWTIHNTNSISNSKLHQNIGNFCPHHWNDLTGFIT